MLLSLEPLPAAEGDCLLLHWGTAAQPRLAVIDGGPAGIFQRHLRKRLLQYQQRSGKQSTEIELVMVSHIDNDHIVGIKDLFSEICDQVRGGESHPTFLAKRLWHNTFNDILNDSLDAYYKEVTTSYTATVAGRPNPRIAQAIENEAKKRDPTSSSDDARELARDVSLILAGHGEGRQLRDDHRFLFDSGLISSLNAPFVSTSGKPTLVRAGAEEIKVAGLKLQVVGPLMPEIKALQIAFDAFIKKNGLTAEAVLAAYADTSVPNLSSIVCLASFGGGSATRTILLTGDARGDKLLDGLKKAGLMGAGPLMVDIMKVPHHGSDNNVKREFFEKIQASAYVLSGDGKYGNPDQKTLRWLTEARGKGDDYDIYLTYSVAHIDTTRERYFAERGYNWSPETHSLAPFLAQRRQEGYLFGLHAGAPVQINLGDELAPW